MIWIVGLEDSEKNLNFSKLLSGESGEEKCVKRKKKEKRLAGQFTTEHKLPQPSHFC